MTEMQHNNERNMEAINVVKQQLIDIKKHVSTRSYSDVIQTQQISKPVSSKQHVVLIRPTDKTKSSSDTENLIKTSVKPLELKIGVKRVKNIRDGGILVECRSEEECEKLAKEIESKTRGVTAHKPKKTQPKIVIKGVNSEIQESQLIDEIICNNPQISQFLDDMSPEEIETHISLKFKFRKKSKSRDDMYCIQVSPQLRTIINQSHKKLFIGWNSCHFEDYLSIIRCYNCNGFGHISSNCKQSFASCGHCGGKHKTEECKTEKSDSFCTNCDKYNKSKNNKQILDCKHSSFSLKCQSFVKVQEIAKSIINYEY
jgi:hypothetical protein